MRANLGRKLILVLTSLVLSTACGATSSRVPTAVVAVATPEPVATDTHTIPANASRPSSVEMYAVLEANQCLSCHIAGGRGTGAVGPSLNGLAERIDTYGLRQSAEAYVYDSLVNPAAYLPASCPTGQCANVMPSYADRLSDDELNALVAFLLSLPSESP